MRPQNWRASVLVLVIACISCSGKKENQESAAAAGGVEVADADKGSPEEKRDQLANHMEELLAETAKLPRAEYDPAAHAAALGNNTQKHFEWVRDHTSWAPYRGLLRGSQGVMLDRVGSNLDRAVLLGDLLRRSGHEVRLAHATLSEAQARELIGKVRPMPAGPMPDDRMASANNGALVDARVVEAKEASARAERLIQSQTAALLAALRETGKQKSNDDSAAIAAMRDHWWVEYKNDGKWTALDVLLPNARVGSTVADATSNSHWNAADASPSIPDGEWHTVDVRIVVERYEAGATSESTVVEAKLRPAETIGVPLRLSHAPVPWPEILADPAVDPEPFRDAALAVKMWIPVLQVGSQQVVEYGFTNEGDLLTDIVDSGNNFSKVGGADVVSGMDMALGGFSPEEIVPAATAEWIDYEISVPGSPVKKLRRPVFDLLGPARRASNAADFDGTAELRALERFESLWAQTDILLQNADFTGAFVTHLRTSGLVGEQKAIKTLARESDAGKAQGLASEILSRIEIWGLLPDYALWRSQLGVQAVDTYVDRPNVLHYRAGRMIVDRKQSGFHRLMDVAANPTGIRHGSTDDFFETRLRQGVADTVIEMLAVAGEFEAVANTASIFDRLAAQNSRGMVISANDEAAVRALPWPEDEIARVAADVNAGYLVVVPRQAVMIGDVQRVGWWRIDPGSGETVGVMDNGYNAMEYPKLVALIAAAGGFLSNPGNMQRMDRVRERASHHVPVSHMAQLARLKATDLARALEADLEFLAKGGGR